MTKIKQLLKNFLKGPVCPKCGGILIQDKCEAYKHIFGFYQIWTCSECGEEWTTGTSI